MKGYGCDKNALIKVFTDSKYANPWAMEQLVTDYNKRFLRNLAEDIKKETSGGLEDTILALIRGPLANDVRAIHKAIEGAGTDKAALADVLLGRSNADVRAIANAYRRQHGNDLLTDIKEDIRDDKMCRIYSMVLAATRQEPQVPVNPQEIDTKVTELQRATEGIVGANEIAVAEILVNANSSQLTAMTELYQRKFHRSLEKVIENEFRGSMEDAFLHMLAQGANQAKADAEWLRSALMRRMGPKDRYFIYRLTTMYWERSRLDAAKEAYQQHFGHKLRVDVLEALEGSYESVVMALIGETKR
jgi:annexin A7/11